MLLELGLSAAGESSEGGSGSLERTGSQPLAAQLSGLSGKSSLSSAAQLSARRGCNSGKSRSSRFKGVSRWVQARALLLLSRLPTKLNEGKLIHSHTVKAR